MDRWAGGRTRWQRSSRVSRVPKPSPIETKATHGGATTAAVSVAARAPGSAEPDSGPNTPDTARRCSSTTLCPRPAIHRVHASGVSSASGMSSVSRRQAASTAMWAPRALRSRLLAPSDTARTAVSPRSIALNASWQPCPVAR